MSFYSGSDFFILLAFVLSGALLVGVCGRGRQIYLLAVSALVTGAVLLKNPYQLAYFIIFFLLELMFVKLYANLRKKYGRNVLCYRLFLLLTLMPLICSKLGELPQLRDVDWYAFLGISYLTFRIAQIIIEMYDGVITDVGVPEFCAYLLFFPTFSCGPIDRSRRFEADYHKEYERKEFLELFGAGLRKLMQGLLYKFVLADVFYQMLTALSGSGIWHFIGYAYCYGVYLFFDFAGYSLMAVGTGYMLGICVPDNFRKPFVSHDMKEFWTRWHISLSEWFRDFVFSRFVMEGMKKKWFGNRLMAASAGFLVNMMLMGIWHGLSLHYIVYGLYHGVLLAGTEIYQKKAGFYKRNKKKRWYRILSWFVTLNLVMFGFLIFSGHLFT